VKQCCCTVLASIQEMTIARDDTTFFLLGVAFFFLEKAMGVFCIPLGIHLYTCIEFNS
jgi:hypothetical protein